VLRQVAEGVLAHQSEFMQTNAVVVQGRAGVLLIDPGVQGHEMACLADDLHELGQPVVAGFSTHPHWDHLLWHPSLGAAPRYGTARCAATVRDRLDFNDTADPLEDYLAALRRLEGAADDVDVFVPGHGSSGGADQVHARIDLDRAYVHALRDADALSDPRIGPSATFGKDWLPVVHERQLRHLARHMLP
jgi:glyoxylase-like metal-dependent hydrolase (beta-lactamase superfamily II)